MGEDHCDRCYYYYKYLYHYLYHYYEEAYREPMISAAVRARESG